MTQYEYAGFEYSITKNENQWVVEPLPNQHPSADKERHKRAALDCFLEDEVRRLRKLN